MRTLSYLLVYIFLPTLLISQEQANIPPEVAKVFSFIMEKDYPEVYADKPYHFRPSGFEVVDIDDDGVIEVFISIIPHYHQTPTILIYKLNSDSSVKRVVECLAPGPLIPRSDERLDCHTVGCGVDMKLPKADSAKLPQLIKSSVKWKMQVVQYPKFIHTGVAKNSGSFVDMSDHTEFADAETCEKFEFSLPEAMISGHLSNDLTHKFLFVLVNKQIYIYRIHKITDDGYLEKTYTIINTPLDFRRFAIDKNGVMCYISSSGETVPLKFDNK